jgi:hypothetical protein
MVDGTEPAHLLFYVIDQAIPPTLQAFQCFILAGGERLFNILRMNCASID